MNWHDVWTATVLVPLCALHVLPFEARALVVLDGAFVAADAAWVLAAPGCVATPALHLLHRLLWLASIVVVFRGHRVYLTTLRRTFFVEAYSALCALSRAYPSLRRWRYPSFVLLRLVFLPFAFAFTFIESEDDPAFFPVVATAYAAVVAANVAWFCHARQHRVPIRLRRVLL